MEAGQLVREVHRPPECVFPKWRGHWPRSRHPGECRWAAPALLAPTRDTGNARSGLLAIAAIRRAPAAAAKTRRMSLPTPAGHRHSVRWLGVPAGTLIGLSGRLEGRPGKDK